MDLDQVYQEADTAKRMAGAAAAFLHALYADQRERATMDFGDAAEREDWHYVPRVRAGLSLKEMDGHQRELAHALIGTGLSAAAHAKARTIIELEEILGAIEGSDRKFKRDSELYYISVFGTPGDSEPWGWRFEGHHISLNYTLVEGRMVAPTPIFFGSNPARVLHGEREGLRALKEEEDLARDLLAALDGEQKSQAIILQQAPADILTRDIPYVRDRVEPEGIASRDMSPGQRELMQALVEVYIHRLPEEIAAVEMGKLERADLLALYFAWAGGQERSQGHYYRVQGPVFMAEYDNTQNDANHIHTVWRDLRNDFGEDLLRSHYQRAH
jgi:hypothetical protein